MKYPWLDACLAVDLPGLLSMTDPAYVNTAEPLPVPTWDDLAGGLAGDRDRKRRERAEFGAAGVCYSCRREPATNGGICAGCLAAKRTRNRERQARRNGLCSWCPAPAQPGRAMCSTCLGLSREKARRQRAELIAAGRCSRCGGPGRGCQCRGASGTPRRRGR